VRVLHYLELESRLDRSGISTAVDHQRAALRDRGVEVLTHPLGDADLAAAVGGLDAWLSGDAGRGRDDTGETEATGADPVVDYDLLHVSTIGPVSLALTEHARRRGRPVVANAHTTREDFAGSFRGSELVGPLLEAYLKRFYSRADVVVCPSEYTKGVLETYPVEAPIRPITNGIDLDTMAGHERLREQYRDRYDLSGTVVFSVGSVFERKGVAEFCEVARRTDHDFAWFGQYDTGPRATQTVRRLTEDPPENVTFTGWVEDKRGAFAAGDVMLLPSAVENQGLVVLESMATGTPPVLSDIPVFREYFTDGEDCLRGGDVEAYVDAVDRLAEDPDLRERLGEGGRATAEDHSLDRVGERLTAVYRDLLAGGAGDEGDTPP
jgi:glycosyltransferase involved in cell wall biosynthesis